MSKKPQIIPKERLFYGNFKLLSATIQTIQIIIHFDFCFPVQTDIYAKYLTLLNILCYIMSNISFIQSTFMNQHSI